MPEMGISRICELAIAFLRWSSITGAFINTSRDIREQFICQKKQFCNAVITKGVIRKAPLLADGDQSAIAQTRKVVGDIRLGETGNPY